MKNNQLKEIVSKSIISILNEVNDPLYAKGMKVAAAYRSSGKVIDNETLSKYPAAFQKGYNYVMHGGGWNRFNNAITSFLGRLGYGRSGI